MKKKYRKLCSTCKSKNCIPTEKPCKDCKDKSEWELNDELKNTDNKEIEKKDMLESIFEQQAKLQEKVGYNIKDLKANQQFISIMTLALIDELMEALHETPWKPWKRQQEWNLANMKEELVDALHFFINLCFGAGMDAKELFNLYTNKNAINHKRQEENY
jgi:dimeric dUTPase (all-alpha-NTP-PPase superfamily)